MDTTYHIRFGRMDGSLACLLVIGRASDASAVRFAHSLCGKSYEHVEVWRGDHCVHAARLKQTKEIKVA